MKESVNVSTGMPCASPRVVFGSVEPYDEADLCDLITAFEGRVPSRVSRGSPPSGMLFRLRIDGEIA